MFILGFDALLIAIFVIAMIMFAARAALIRLSPRYDAKRQLKAQVRYDQQEVKRRATRQAKRDRLQQWAIGHPDDPVATGYLDKVASKVTSFSRPEEPVAFDPGEELRHRQQYDDDLKRRSAERQAASEREAQQLLDWAIDHAETPEGFRHLHEVMDRVTKQIEHHDAMIGYGKSTLGYSTDEVTIADATSQVEEEETLKRQQEEILERVQQALASSPRSDIA